MDRRIAHASALAAALVAGCSTTTNVDQVVASDAGPGLDGTAGASDASQDASVPDVFQDVGSVSEESGDTATWSANGSVGSDGAPRPDAMVSAIVSSGPNGGLCPFAVNVQFVTIGAPTGPKPVTVSDGSSQAGAIVSVACSVVPSGAGFNVQASATIQGVQGGSLTIIGYVDASGGSNLRGGFTGLQGQSYDQATGCTVSYTMNGQPVPATPPVAGGRIWGHIDCVTAQATGVYRSTADGGTTLAQCDGRADFLFENCTGG